MNNPVEIANRLIKETIYYKYYDDLYIRGSLDRWKEEIEFLEFNDDGDFSDKCFYFKQKERLEQLQSAIKILEDGLK